MFFHKRQNFYSLNLEMYIENLRKGDLSYIPLIFCVFAEDSSKHKLRAAQALNEALSLFSLDDICRVNMRMQETTSIEWSIDWRTLSTEDFITKQMSEDEQRAVLIFSSFNPNGYIRQRAVELLTLYDHTLPFILLRFSDWVYAVRQSALTMLLERIKIATEEEVVEALSFAEKLRKSERCEYATILSIMANKLDGNMTLIKKGLMSQDIRGRRFCISIIADLPTTDSSVLFAHIKNEKDPFLRKMIFQLLLKTNTDIRELSKQLLKDKYPPNRILALQALYDYKSHIVFEIAENMLLDKNSQVRTLAKDIVSKSGRVIDFHQFYLDNLYVNTSASLYELGEVGSREDCQLMVKFLKDDRVSVIRAAMISLMRLNPEAFLPRITETLASKEVGIVKTAVLILKKYGFCNFERAFEIQESSPYENTKIKCATLLFSDFKWQSLIYTLRLLGSDYEKLEATCQTQISKWIATYNRSYRVASEKEIETIKILISEKTRFLSPQAEKQLLFLL